MNLIAATAVSAILALAAPASAGPPRAPLSRDAALEVLRTTDTFAGTHVGFGGEPSEQACAFATLIREPDADALFKSLVAGGSLAGQLYGLCGIFYTDPEAFRRTLEPYRGATDSVNTLDGCIGGRKRISDIVEHVGPGAVRLDSPKDDIGAWAKRNPQLDSFFLDILGGGYPAELKAMKPCHGVRGPR
jgi:hypothetical protein